MTLSSAIDELAALHASIAQEINQLSNLVTSDESSRAKLAARIHNEFRIADAACEAADRLLLYFDDSTVENNGKTKSELAIKLHEVEEDLTRDRTLFRKSQLKSRKTTIKTQKEERALLFSKAKLPDSESTRASINPSTHPPSSRALHTAEDATASLKRTHQLLEMEIAKSEYSLDVLDESNVKLRKLTEKYTAFDVVLGTSRRVISILEQADKYDRIYMLCSMGFLLIVLLWILWRRVLRGPARLLIWTAVKSFGIVSWVTGRRESKNVIMSKDVNTLTLAMNDVISTLASDIESYTTASSETIQAVATTIAAAITTVHDEL
ncbi:Sec20-domain-containing protein [Lipomyces arxii]|uniref:Sec20-domain-containing protein n=1 Tax=Lipomyces arxii TaxID=56418 RepID=UPI0034CECDBD